MRPDLGRRVYIVYGTLWRLVISYGSVVVYPVTVADLPLFPCEKKLGLDISVEFCR